MNSTGGNFSHRENLHLTLAFLGEIPENHIPRITSAMDAICAPAFSLTVGKVSSFRKDGLYFLEISAPGELYDIQSALTQNLKAEGFRLENRKFSPHLTIGREVKLKPGFDLELFNGKLSPIPTVCTRLSLMKSERLRGKLTYTEIYGKDLTI